MLCSGWVVSSGISGTVTKSIVSAGGGAPPDGSGAASTAGSSGSACSGTFSAGSSTAPFSAGSSTAPVGASLACAGHADAPLPALVHAWWLRYPWPHDLSSGAQHMKDKVALHL